MIKAVLDTNVLVSALFWKGAPHAVVREGIAGAFCIVSSPDIMEELLETLIEKFSVSIEDTRKYLRVITVHSLFAQPKEIPHVVLVDPSDDKIIACAANAGADYIVSGYRHLFSFKEFSGIRLVFLLVKTFQKKLNRASILSRK